MVRPILRPSEFTEINLKSDQAVSEDLSSFKNFWRILYFKNYDFYFMLATSTLCFIDLFTRYLQLNR